MYPISKSFLFILSAMLLGACSPDMSTREASLTQIALMGSLKKSHQFQHRIQEEVDRGTKWISEIEDTSNHNRVLILKLDTVFQIRYKRKMDEWTQQSEKGLKVSRTFQQKVQDRSTRLRGSSWEESVGDRSVFEEEEIYFGREIDKMEKNIAIVASELWSLSNSMDTIPVPRPTPPPPPVYIPPVPQPMPDLPVADPNVPPS